MAAVERRGTARDHGGAFHRSGTLSGAGASVERDGHQRGFGDMAPISLGSYGFASPTALLALAPGVAGMAGEPGLPPWLEASSFSDDLSRSVSLRGQTVSVGSPPGTLSANFVGNRVGQLPVGRGGIFGLSFVLLSLALCGETARLNMEEPRGPNPRRLRLALWLLAALASAILARTLWLQLGGPERWSQRARQQQTANLAEPPSRGRLLDRRGQVIVDHVPRFHLHREGPSEPPKELQDYLTPRSLSLLEDGLPAPVEVEALPAVSELLGSSPGLSLQQISTRAYPLGTLACHAMGYIREEEIKGSGPGRVMTVGVDGLEAVYDHRLRGLEGTRIQLVSATGVPLGLVSETPPTDGEDLRTSLDLDLQKAAERAMARVAQDLAERPNRRSKAPGVALMMDARGGEILVMASRPTYDPALFLNGDRKLEKLLSDPDSPMINRALAGLYPPASTFKLVTAAAVLEHHPQWARESFYCEGSRTIGETVFHCFVTTGHGHLTFEEAIAVSCDTVFYDLATRMSPEELVSTAKRLGFGDKTGIDLPGESAGHLPDPAERKREGQPWYAGDSANFGIGQGATLATPLQVLTATARLLGSPKLKPRMLLGAKPSGPLKLRPELEPLWAGTRGAVSYGTAGGVYVEGLEIAGKTGTAEAPTTAQNPQGLNHTWLVAWAPARAPEVVALAFFEGSGGYGGEVAGPVVQEMLKTWKEKQVKEKSIQNGG